MTLFRILCILPFCFTTGLPAQHIEQYFISGHFGGSQEMLDSIVIDRAISSVMTDTYVLAKSGESREVLHLNHTHWNSEFLSLLQLPGEWNSPSWDPYQPKIDSIFGLDEKLTGREPDLRWLIQAYSHQLNGDSLFHRYYAVPQEWHPTPILPPANGWLTLNGEEFSQFQEHFIPKNSHDSSARAGLMQYQGKNHFLAWGKDSTYRRVWKKRNQRLWQTAHGLIWQKGNQYTWLFTSNGNLTGGPQKLSFSSLSQIQVVDGLILLHHVAPVMQWNQLFLIDPETGIVGDIDLDEEIKIGEFDKLAFEVKQGELVILRSESKFVPQSYEARLDWEELKTRLRQMNPDP